MFREPGYQFFSPTSSPLPRLPLPHPLFLPPCSLPLRLSSPCARLRRRQAVWLVLGSPSRYYHIRYKNRNPNAPSRGAFYRESTSHRVDAVVPLGQRRLVLLACSILAINFLPASFVLSFPPGLPRFLSSLSLLPADCITLCRRQAVWPVYSSVASSPLSFSRLSLSLPPFLFLF